MSILPMNPHLKKGLKWIFYAYKMDDVKYGPNKFTKKVISFLFLFSIYLIFDILTLLEIP